MTNKTLIAKSWAVLSKNSRKKLLLSSGAQSILAILDVIGIALMGVIGSIGLNYVSGIPIPLWMETTLNRIFGVNYQATDALLFLSILAAILFTTKSLLNLGLSHKVAIYLAQEQVRLSKVFIEKLATVDYKWLRKQEKQNLIYAATDGINAIFLGILQNSVIIVSDSFLLLLIAVTLIVIDPGTAIMTILLFGVIAYGLQKIIGNYLEEQGKKITKSAISGRDDLDNFFYAYKEISVLRRQHLFLDNYLVQREIYSSAYARNGWAQLIPKYVIEVGMILGASLIIGYQVLTSTAAESLSTLLIFISAASRLTPALLRIQSSILYVRNSQAMATVTFDFMSQMDGLNFSSYRESSPEIQNRVNDPVRISVENVVFSFPDELGKTLDQINFVVEPGELVAIVGHSGSGKSTLLDLMLGVMSPTEGEININGVTVNSWLNSNPGSVSYVQQQPYIYNKTLKENITLQPEDGDYNSHELARILEITGLNDLSEKNDGKGKLQNLSGGEKQRLAMARALYLKPSMLVIDEGTSSLDAISENAISESVLKLKGLTTTVVVSHRLSSIREADKIFYLSGGCIRGVGSFQELYSSNEDFRKLVQAFNV
jgi:ABC-type multidrug transport system fused ATPase/permease subunit